MKQALAFFLFNKMVGERKTVDTRLSVHGGVGCRGCCASTIGEFVQCPSQKIEMTDLGEKLG